MSDFALSVVSKSIPCLPSRPRKCRFNTRATIETIPVVTIPVSATISVMETPCRGNRAHVRRIASCGAHLDYDGRLTRWRSFHKMLRKLPDWSSAEISECCVSLRDRIVRASGHFTNCFWSPRLATTHAGTSLRLNLRS